MSIFESDPQYREKLTQWRIFALSPMFMGLARGHIFRWFAVNIPMDLGTGGIFTSDIDIIARLRTPPPSSFMYYKTWEVKVSLLCKDGSARSLKIGKIDKILKQLRAYRKFGAPQVSLLDIYICESGFMHNNEFPTESLKPMITSKYLKLERENFGYEIFPFEHERGTDETQSFQAFSQDNLPSPSPLMVNPSIVQQSREPFARLGGCNLLSVNSINGPVVPFRATAA